jgi:hypothetical protein
MGRFFCRLAALGFGLAFLAGLVVYPMEGHGLLPILLCCAGVLLWRPALWLFLLPALLPALDLAPVTGWFFLEEIDLLLLLICAVCYWAMPADQRSGATLPLPFAFCLGWMALACLVGLWRGVQLAPFDANAFNNYLSPYNALRIGKGWCWGFLLLAPLRSTAGPDLAGLRRYFVPGMLCGLLLVVSADVRERLLFPGLLNFSSDYRTSAPFSAMHTGGAALDAYLALSSPMLYLWLKDRRAMAAQLAGMALLALALYAVLSTFSRGLYAAALLALLIVLGLKPAQGPVTAGRQPQGAALAPWALAAALAAVLYAVFGHCGYRGLGAALVLLAAAFSLSGQTPQRGGLARALAWMAALELLLALLLAGVPPRHPLLKPPYFLFCCCALAYAGAWGRGRARLSAATAALLGLGINSVWIAWHWAGAAALPSSIALLGLSLLLVWPAFWRSRAWQPVRRAGLQAHWTLLLILGVAVPFTHGAYTGERLSSTLGDLDYRIAHWRRVAAMMDDGPAGGALGMGLGAFPAAYYWRNSLRELPASHRYVDLDYNRFLELNGGNHPAGYGEPLRVMQQLSLLPDHPYLLAFDAANPGPAAFLHLAICARMLLYPMDCRAGPTVALAAHSAWKHYQYPLRSAPATPTARALGRPWRLELAAEGQGATVAVDNLSLRDALSHHELLRNGTFTDGNNYWFFSSDRHHLPWHVKNVAMNLYFELGWFGLLAFCATTACALAVLLGRARHGEGALPASAWLAALAAALTVGLFDSLFDVPRITVLFMLLLCAGMLRPAAGAARPPCARP